MKPFLFVVNNANVSSETKLLCLFAIGMLWFKLGLTFAMKFDDIWQGIKSETTYKGLYCLHCDDALI